MQFSKVESVYLMSGGFDLAVMVHGDSIQDIAMFVAKDFLHWIRFFPQQLILS